MRVYGATVKYLYCKYCGARLKRDSVGQYCGTRNCQWEYGLSAVDDTPTPPIVATKKITRLECTCERCDWHWVTRGEKPPQVCPNCKQKDWNKPRQTK